MIFAYDIFSKSESESKADSTSFRALEFLCQASSDLK